jgi:hypothetical protein
VDAPPRGPFVKAALFCEKMLQEKDGVASLIRIVDRVTQRAVGPVTPAAVVPFNYGITFVAMLTPGDARGRADFTVDMTPPSGVGTKQVANGTVHFEGETRGVNITAQMNLQLQQEGIYWFDIKVDGAVLTRMALELRYERVTTQATGQQ